MTSFGKSQPVARDLRARVLPFAVRAATLYPQPGNIHGANLSGRLLAVVAQGIRSRCPTRNAFAPCKASRFAL